MRPASFLLWSALTGGVVCTFQVTTNAAASSSTTTTTTTSSSSSSHRLIPVLVGGTTLTFTPNLITAQPGDVIQFQFAARNHTVTESLQDTPCQPIDINSTAVNGLHSGFIAFNAASGNVGTFDVPVKDTKPMFLYCAQAAHCQSGMVMMINGDSNTLIDYANSAALAKKNTPAQLVSGGVVAAIPLADSVLATSSGTDTGTSSSSITSTKTVTGTAGGGTATATVTQANVIGGGTATAVATVTVGHSDGSALGPSGIATASGNATDSTAGDGGAVAAAAAATPKQVTTSGARMVSNSLGMMVNIMLAITGVVMIWTVT